VKQPAMSRILGGAAIVGAIWIANMAAGYPLLPRAAYHPGGVDLRIAGSVLFMAVILGDFGILAFRGGSRRYRATQLAGGFNRIHPKPVEAACDGCGTTFSVNKDEFDRGVRTGQGIVCASCGRTCPPKLAAQVPGLRQVTCGRCMHRFGKHAASVDCPRCKSTYHEYLDPAFSGRGTEWSVHYD
jgi:hypothetical protein